MFTFIDDDDEQKSHAHVIILAIIEREPDVLFRLMYALRSIQLDPLDIRSQCESFLYMDESVEDPYLSITSGTILHYAAHFGNRKIVEALILSDATRCSLMDPDVITVEGYTPLHMASRSGNVEVVQILLDAGSDIEAKDRDGRTPLHSAMLGSIDAILMKLDPVRFAWPIACPDKMIRFLLKAGSDVNAEDIYNLTPLHLASDAGNVDIVRILLDEVSNVNVNAKDIYGYTPLHEAVLCNNVEIARILIAEGSDIEARNDDGQTPLQIALKYGHVDIGRILLDAGADKESI